MSESNTVALFSKERLEITGDNSDKVSLSQAYSAYCDWCVQYGIQRVDTKQQFRGVLEDIDIWYGKYGKNISGFRAVKLIEEDIEDFEDI